MRLFFDESLFGDDDADKITDSGSDVRLTGDSGPKLEAEADDEIDLSGWGSDVKLSDSDSDVQLVGAATEAEVDLGITDMLKNDRSLTTMCWAEVSCPIRTVMCCSLQILNSNCPTPTATFV